MKAKLSAQFNWVTALMLLTLSSCALLSGDAAPPSAKGDIYQLHFQRSGWSVRQDKRADYVWSHHDGRVLLANSFCDQFQSGSLEDYAIKTARSVEQLEILDKKITHFRSREAFMLKARGKVDGVEVNLTLLNSRRNNCYFDFVSIIPGTTPAQPSFEKDFDYFLESVEFR